MTTVTAHLTNKAYGYPTRGAGRRIKAPILACIHITGNRRTAANPDRHEAARGRARPTRTARARMDLRPTTTSPATAGRSRPSTQRRARRLVERRRREPEHRERRRREGARSARQGLQRQRGVLARDRVRRLRLDLPDHQGPAAVLRGTDRRDGQGDGTCPSTAPRFMATATSTASAERPALFEGESRGVPRRRHRPGERDPAAADHHGHRRRPATRCARSPPRTGSR